MPESTIYIEIIFIFLQEIYLDWNSLTSVPSNSLNGPTALRHLSLKHNFISTLKLNQFINQIFLILILLLLPSQTLFAMAHSWLNLIWRWSICATTRFVLSKALLSRNCRSCARLNWPEIASQISTVMYSSVCPPFKSWTYPRILWKPFPW